jgi:hypothetical protein
MTEEAFKVHQEQELRIGQPQQTEEVTEGLTMAAEGVADWKLFQIILSSLRLIEGIRIHQDL